MGKPIAKENDVVKATDVHVVLVNGSPTPTPLPFLGRLSAELSRNVKAEWRAVAVRGSVAAMAPGHVAPNGPFQTPPENQGRVEPTSRTVFANDLPVARDADPATTCNDQQQRSHGTVVAGGSVLVGDCNRPPAF
jgi:hypothetical protein